MLLGKVVGTVVATQKEENLEGMTFKVIRPLDLAGVEQTGYVVAVDAVGAEREEVVLYATGSSARQTALTDRRPVDAVIMGIVDTWEVHGREHYRK